MIYLYAITDRPDVPLPAVPGLGGEDVSILIYRDIGAVISPFTMTSAPPTKANLWGHETIIETAMADHTILPTCFGTALTDKAAVRAALTEHYDEFADNLKRVRGHVELALRVLLDDDNELSPASDFQSSTSNDSGSAYMMARIEEERQTEARRRTAEAAAADIHIPLARLATESTHRIEVAEKPSFTAAYLVAHDQVPVFLSKVETIGSIHPELRFLCTGPWPPFSFVAMGSGRQAADDR